MRHIFAQTALAACCAVLSTTLSAQTALNKPAAQQPAAAKSASKKPAPQKPAAPQASKALSDEQLAIADMVTTGRISCADGRSVTLTPDAKTRGAFDLKFGSTTYAVVPVPAKSGAVRLEDRKSGIVFMQLANKSMLFNERAGKRLADDCISPNQQMVAEQMKSQTGNGLLDGPSR